MNNEMKLKEIKQQILDFLKDNNAYIVAEHCHWDGHYVSIRIDDDEIRIKEDETS